MATSGGELEVAVLPLRDVVAFPHATRSFNVGRPRSQRMIESLVEREGDRTIALVLQRDPNDDDPSLVGLHPIGTLARVVHWAPARHDGGSYIVLTAGLQRVRLLRETQRDPFLIARVELLEDEVPSVDDVEYQALRDSLRRLLASYLAKAENVSTEVQRLLDQIDDAAVLTDVAAATIADLSLETRQSLLETVDVRERLRRLVEELIRQNEKLDVERKIESDVRERLVGAQRETLLREQLRAIQRELHQGEDAADPVDELERRVLATPMPEEVRSEARRELRRLRQIPPASPEYTVVLSYLDWIVSLPWSPPPPRDIDVGRAERILDEDHYDIARVKARILEHLAVLRLRGDSRGPLLCFVGPPGVGKTSLGRSIARALDRPFVRISLGGMSDEAELRGHRRTYIGALPGQIIQALRRAGARDPVFMLDEVDKLGRDFRGDPAAALLEILDPAQNYAFRDRFLDLPFDLSKVLFIGTANLLDPIPSPLLDRMEVLQLSGYDEEEKIPIADRYLIPKQVQESGLTPERIRFTREALRVLVRRYTHEAGVRGLERQIGALCRKYARRIATGAADDLAAAPLEVTPEVVARELGVPPFHVDVEIERRTRQPGVAVGLAWTPTGGDILFIEATRLPEGRGNLTLTGQLGDVMQESARAALTWLRANGDAYAIAPAALRDADIHVHVPAGAVPKDGPSAGVALATALASALTARPVRPFVAMTGEITLSGYVLPVGGIREKVLAARRSGLREVVLPEMNRPNVEQDIPIELRDQIIFHFVATVDEALAHALGAPVTGHGVSASGDAHPPSQPVHA
jgi:ATP-dependent Lon protease